MAIGSERNRGNNGIAPGYLNSATAFKRVQFKARLWDFKLPTAVSETQLPTLAFYFYAMSSWSGKARGLFITLGHWNIDNSDSNGNFKNLKWNWPVQESFYHPGVEWVLIDAEDVHYYCGFTVSRMVGMGSEKTFDLNLQTLFQCLSNWNAWETQMPSSLVVPIHGVHWSVEMTGRDGWIYTSVHDMKMAN